jgi:hypothetical protein
MSEQPQHASGTFTGSATLTRELSDFLVQFSISLNKHAIYPPGHPQLAEATREVTSRLAVLLRDRPALSIGVARNQLVIEGVATDPDHPLLRDLAQRLHRHQIVAIRFAPGVSDWEAQRFLTALAVDADRSEDPVGLRAESVTGLERIVIRAAMFDQLALLAEDGSARGTGPGAGGDLWLGLARAALESDLLAADDHRLHDPIAIANAIDGHSREVAYDQVIVGYLLQISEELRRGPASESAALRDRVSQMIGTLRPETLARLLEMGGDATQRRHFLLDASHALAVDAVVELIEAAALASGQTMSHALARLLHKLAAVATSADERAAIADGEFRGQVRRLVRGWTLADPTPDEYRAMLDRMARAVPELMGAEHGALPEAARTIAMSLELGVIEEPTLRAIDALLDRGELAVIVALMDAADAGVVEGMWRELAEPSRLSRLLAQEPVDAAQLQRLVEKGGSGTAEPLLEALERSPSRGSRRVILEQLVGLGPAAAAAAVRRLPNAPWYLVRNVLILVRRVGVIPDGWSPAEYLSHEDPRVRGEALRVMLAQPALRERAIIGGIRDADPALARIALGAASTTCPRSAVAPIIRRLAAGELDAELASLALRALAASGTREGLEQLLQRSVERTFFGRKRLAHRSPELLAALAGLAAHWRHEPRAAAALTLAAAHGDPTVRAAAGPADAAVT